MIRNEGLEAKKAATIIESEIALMQEQLKNTEGEKDYLVNKHEREKKQMKEEIELLKSKLKGVVKESPKNSNDKK